MGIEAEPPRDDIEEEIRRRRQQARWNAFFTPIITLASIVISIGLLMFFIRTCQERFPVAPRFKDAPKKPSPANGAKGFVMTSAVRRLQHTTDRTVQTL